MNRTQKILAGTAALAAGLSAAQLTILGYRGGIGPLKELKNIDMRKFPGNASRFSPSRVKPDKESPLAGKRILFLGSSVTYGACSLEKSMADYLAAKDGAVITKEAVNGTTLADNDNTSYVARLKKFDNSQEFDCVVCQLSTNDARKKIPVGKVAEGTGVAAFDTKTVVGALEYIIAYVKIMWDCPMVIYTGTKYESEQYAQMVAVLPDLVKKWGITVIDLWNDPGMNAVLPEDYKLYMHDPVHPTQAGYLVWWLPKFEEHLTALLASKGKTN